MHCKSCRKYINIYGMYIVHMQIYIYICMYCCLVAMRCEKWNLLQRLARCQQFIDTFMNSSTKVKAKKGERQKGRRKSRADEGKAQRQR